MDPDRDFSETVMALMPKWVEMAESLSPYELEDLFHRLNQKPMPPDEIEKAVAEYAARRN